MKPHTLILITLPLLGCSDNATSSTSSTSDDLPTLHFTDVTADSGIDWTITSGSLPPTYLLDTLGTGIALIDYDLDGDADIFVPNGATVAAPYAGPGCRLFENLGGMRFQDVTEQAGLKFARWGFGVAQGDIDNDGWPDLFVSCYGRNAMLRNTGKGGFMEVSRQAGLAGKAWSTGAAFGDIDNDGDLDLYVVNYCALDLRKPSPQREFSGVSVFAGPMGLPKVADVLYLNDGRGHFSDISRRSGIHARPPSWGLGAVILDFDGDGIQDIFVGNDSTASYLYRGIGDGKFQEDGIRSGVALSETGAGQATMGIAVGDVDDNGRPDLFTTNFMYDTNTLHLNMGDSLFVDKTMDYGLHIDSRPFLSWATGLFDFDHDADEDLVFFNGHIYPRATCDENRWDYDQIPVLYRRAERRFQRLDAATAGDWLAEPHCDRSSAFGDLDGDGDIDMVIAESNGPLRILRNDRDGGAWLVVHLRDERSGHDLFGTGAQVVLHAAGRTQRRWMVSGKGYFSSDEPIAHFAAPGPSGNATLEIHWPDGFVQEVPAVEMGQSLTVRREE